MKLTTEKQEFINLKSWPTFSSKRTLLKPIPIYFFVTVRKLLPKNDLKSIFYTRYAFQSGLGYFIIAGKKSIFI